MHYLNETSAPRHLPTYRTVSKQHRLHWELTSPRRQLSPCGVTCAALEGERPLERGVAGLIVIVLVRGKGTRYIHRRGTSMGGGIAGKST